MGALYKYEAFRYQLNLTQQLTYPQFPRAAYEAELNQNVRAGHIGDIRA